MFLKCSRNIFTLNAHYKFPFLTKGIQFSSVQSLSRVWLFLTPWTAASKASLSITNSRSLPKLMSMSRWCHPTILSSLVPFSFRIQSFSASGSFPMSQFFTSGDQSIGASALASVLPMTLQDWFPFRLTGLISLQSKGLSRVSSNTTVQKPQFFSTQLSFLFNSHNHTWLLEKITALTRLTFVRKRCLCFLICCLGWS